MMVRFQRDTKGVAAVEFALIVPILIMLMFGALVFPFVFWTKNGLQETAEQTARCVAIRSVLCANVPTGCDSSVASTCYAETIARLRGISNLKAAEVSVNAANTIGGVSFTTINIVHPFSVAGYNFTLTVVGSFPNNV